MRMAGRYLRMECGVSYAFRMAEPVYGIDDFSDDDSLWRVEWIGSVGYNTSVPSDPRITVCLTQLPPGETNPLSARARSWQTKTTAKISVGLLPYSSIVSVWQRIVLPGRNFSVVAMDASLHLTVARRFNHSESSAIRK
jgi:hypothetical protein